MNPAGEGELSLVERLEQVELEVGVLDVVVPMRLVCVGLGALLELMGLEGLKQLSQLRLMKLSGYLRCHMCSNVYVALLKSVF